MSVPSMKREGLTERVRHELTEYAFDVIQLEVVIAALTTWRRLLLSAHDIPSTSCWFALIEAPISWRRATR